MGRVNKRDEMWFRVFFFFFFHILQCTDKWVHKGEKEDRGFILFYFFKKKKEDKVKGYI